MIFSQSLCTRSLQLNCVFWLSGPLYPCFAYAIVNATPARPQREPTRIMPLKVCLRRANARVEPAGFLFAYAVTLPAALGSLETNFFAYATTVPSTFLLGGMPCGNCRGTSQQAPNRTLLPAAAQAPRLQSAHKHLAATPCSRTS